MFSLCKIDGEVRCKFSSDLYIENCNEDDAEKLKKFRFVKKLTICDCKTENLSFLKNMPFLTNLFIISNNKINDWSVLLKCKRIKSIFVVGVEFQDLNCFSEMKDIESLYINSFITEPLPEIKSANGLENISSSLENLTLHGLENTDKISLNKFYNLRTLGIDYSSITEISINNPNLEWLSLSKNFQLNSIFISEKCKKLNTIIINDTPVKIDVNKILALPSLNKIVISDGQYSDEEILTLESHDIEVKIS